MVNYRLGGLVNDAGDNFLSRDDDARDQAATAAAALAAVQQERNAVAGQLAVVEQQRDAALAARDRAREQLCMHLVYASLHIQNAQREREAAIASRNSAREDLCIRLVHATLHIQAADAHRAAAEERLNQVVEQIDVAVQQTVDNFVLMLTDAYFEAAVLEAEKVELGAELKDTKYDLSRLQNPT